MRSLTLLLALAACNGAPEGGDLAIEPVEPRTGDDLTAVVTEDAVDPNDDAVTWSWAWTVDGEPAGIDSDIVPSAETSKGQVWSVTAVPSDGKKTGEALTAEVTIANTAPVIADVAITPGDVPVTGTLQAAWTVTDADEDATEVVLSWTVGGTEVGSGETLSASSLSKGDAVSLTVTATDGTDEAEPVTVGPVTILNTPPTAASAAITPGEPSPGDDLLCGLETAATDIDGDALSYTASWTVDGEAYTGPTTTTTHADDTIPAASTAVDQVWTCSLAASDGDATTPGTESDGVTVILPPGVSFRAGYYFVIADYNADASDHAVVCEGVGLAATERRVTLTWDATLLANLSADFGFESAGDTDCCASTMWCFDGEDSELTSALDGQCETHNFGSEYDNYGRYRAQPGQLPVFTCTVPSGE